MQEKVYFENSKGDKLCGVLSDPTEDQSERVVVLVHGFSSSKDRPTFTGLERELNERGMATFRIDLFGHGESEGEFEDVTISQASDDILKAVDLMKQKGYEKVGLMGSSFGGISSIMAASKTNDLYMLVLKCPVSSYPEKIEVAGTNMEDDLSAWREKGHTYYKKSNGERLKINFSFFEDSKSNDGYVAAQKIKIPVFVIHGDADSTVPVEQSKKIAGILENCRLEIVPGADHAFDKGGQFDKMIKSIVDFIVENSKS